MTMKPFTILAAAVVPLGLSTAALAGPTFSVTLTPLNNSGVSGTATFELNDAGDMLIAAVAATGLAPNQVHPQHIHGFDDPAMNSVIPPASAAGADGILTVPEGAPFYGKVRLPLVTGESSGFPMSDASGNLSYTHIFDNANAAAASTGPGGVAGLGSTLAAPIISISDLFPLENREFVIHGVTVDGQYMATLPAAAGELVLVDGTGGTPAVVPLPGAGVAGLATLGLTGGVGYVRRRRATA